jgi:hypothetical protein
VQPVDRLGTHVEARVRTVGPEERGEVIGEPTHTAPDLQHLRGRLEPVALQQCDLVLAPAFEAFGLAPEPDRMIDVVGRRELSGGRMHATTLPYRSTRSPPVITGRVIPGPGLSRLGGCVTRVVAELRGASACMPAATESCT